MANASGNRGALSGITLVWRPLVLLIAGTFVVFIFELITSSVLAYRRGLSPAAVWRLAFGQPRWWQAWYPRSVRAPDNVWDEMSFAMRASRTIVWLALMSIPHVVQFSFVVRPLSELTAGVGLALPLPTRIAIAASGVVLQALGIALLIAAALVGLSAVRERVPVPEVIRLLFTWRRESWETAAGRALLRKPGTQDPAPAA